MRRCFFLFGLSGKRWWARYSWFFGKRWTTVLLRKIIAPGIKLESRTSRPMQAARADARTIYTRLATPIPRHQWQDVTAKSLSHDTRTNGRPGRDQGPPLTTNGWRHRCSLLSSRLSFGTGHPDLGKKNPVRRSVRRVQESLGTGQVGLVDVGGRPHQ